MFSSKHIGAQKLSYLALCATQMVCCHRTMDPPFPSIQYLNVCVGIQVH